MGAYLGYYFHTFVWKLLSLPLEIQYMGAYLGVGTCPGHYSNREEGRVSWYCNDIHEESGFTFVPHYIIMVWQLYIANYRSSIVLDSQTS